MDWTLIGLMLAIVVGVVVTVGTYEHDLDKRDLYERDL